MNLIDSLNEIDKGLSEVKYELATALLPILRQSTPFEWVPQAARYRNKSTGRFVRVDVVEQWSSNSITATQQVVTDFSAQANDNPLAWFEVMRSEIKSEYIRQYLTGAGGRNNMTSADWGRVGGMISDQYNYLDGFLSEVIQGDLSTEAIAARSRMYINSAREAFAVSSQKSHGIAGYTEKTWELGETEQHCEDCPVLASLGWVAIDFEYKVGNKVAHPGNGATQCLTNCDCRYKFRK